MDYVVEPLAPQHDRAAFSCGEPSLDAYIQRQAGQDVRRDLAICYILCARGSPEVIGYYTLSAYSVEFTALPPELAKQSGRYRLVPAILLGRLAVAARFQGQGMSAILITDALQRALRTGVGVKLVIVDALNERAASFYERRDFLRLKDYPLRLFLPTSKIREMFPSEGKRSDDA